VELPKRVVLEEWPEDGETMEFRLLFRGHLPSEDKADVEMKHNIRKQLHPQLREVWKGHPSMRGSFEPKKNGVSRVEEIAGDYSKCGFRFVPLIRKKDNACSLNIIILFRHEPYRAYNYGDLDNRIKTLVDGLRMPDQCSEVTGQSPSADEDPFFVLMDDDRVIYEFQVTTDQLFVPYKPEEEKYRDVFAVIGIRMTTVGRNPITYLS
jgi:hypothetical protein